MSNRNFIESARPAARFVPLEIGANASTNPTLRRLALELFQIYRRRDAAGTTTN